MEHHWCSTISITGSLVPRGHLFPPPLSTSCKLSNNTSFAIRQMHNCHGCTCNQVFLVKNSKSSPTSKHIQHSSCPESGLHLCFPSSRLSRHTLQTSQWNDLSLWILFKTKKKRFWKIDRFSSPLCKWNPYRAIKSLCFQIVLNFSLEEKN